MACAGHRPRRSVHRVVDGGRRRHDAGAGGAPARRAHCDNPLDCSACELMPPTVSATLARDQVVARLVPTVPPTSSPDVGRERISQIADIGVSAVGVLGSIYAGRLAATIGKDELLSGRSSKTQMRRSLLAAVLAFLALPGTVAFAVPLLLLRPAAPGSFSFPSILLVAAGLIVLLWCVRDFYVAGKGTLAPRAPRGASCDRRTLSRIA
jgi:hypothetical protein